MCITFCVGYSSVLYKTYFALGQVSFSFNIDIRFCVADDFVICYKLSHGPLFLMFVKWVQEICTQYFL